METVANIANINEQTTLDNNIACVRNVNKYLRKALRKIADILDIGDEDNKIVENRANCDVDSLGNSERKSKKLKLDCFESTNTDKIESENTIVRTDDELNENDETIEVSSDDNDNILLPNVNSSETVLVKPTIERSKFEVVNKTSTLKNDFHCEWYKVFVTNLPVSADVMKVIKWIKSKGQPEPDNIVMSSKQTFKTCILSYTNRENRDLLLNLDGHLFEDVNIKIKKFVTDHSPVVDKIVVGSKPLRTT